MCEHSVADVVAELLHYRRQQICTSILALIIGMMSMREALPHGLLLAGAAQVMAGGGALFLDDTPVEDEGERSSDEDNLDLAMESDAESTVCVS